MGQNFLSAKDYCAIQFRDSSSELYVIVHWVRHKKYGGGTWPFETVCGIKLGDHAYDYGRAQYARPEDIKSRECKNCSRIRNKEMEIESNWEEQRKANTPPREKVTPRDPETIHS